MWKKLLPLAIAEEDFAVASLTDTAHLQLAAYINRHLIDDGALSLGKAQSIFLHMDLFGPIAYISIGGSKYCLVIVDDYSRFTWVFFLQE